MAVKLSMQKRETPASPGAIWGWQISHTTCAFFLKGCSLEGQGERAFTGWHRLGLQCCSGETSFPTPTTPGSVDGRRKVSILCWADGLAPGRWGRLQVKPCLGWGGGAALGHIYIPGCSRGATHSPGWTCWSLGVSREIGRIRWHFHIEVSSEYRETV